MNSWPDSQCPSHAQANKVNNTPVLCKQAFPCPEAAGISLPGGDEPAQHMHWSFFSRADGTQSHGASPKPRSEQCYHKYAALDQFKHPLADQSIGESKNMLAPLYNHSGEVRRGSCSLFKPPALLRAAVSSSWGDKVVEATLSHSSPHHGVMQRWLRGLM